MERCSMIPSFCLNLFAWEGQLRDEFSKLEAKVKLSPS